MSPRPVRLGEPACGDWVRSETPLPWRRSRGADAVGPPLRHTPDALLHWGSGGVPAGPRTEFTACEPSRGGRQAPIQAPRTRPPGPPAHRVALGAAASSPRELRVWERAEQAGCPRPTLPALQTALQRGCARLPLTKAALCPVCLPRHRGLVPQQWPGLCSLTWHSKGSYGWRLLPH